MVVWFFLFCLFVCCLDVYYVTDVIITRIGASLGLRMKLKTIFKSDFDLPMPLFFNMSKQLLVPRGLNNEC